MNKQTPQYATARGFAVDFAAGLVAGLGTHPGKAAVVAARRYRVDWRDVYAPHNPKLSAWWRQGPLARPTQRPKKQTEEERNAA